MPYQKNLAGMQKDLHKSHKTHRNVLYSLAILLLMLQVMSFVLISLQVSKLSAKLSSEIERTQQATEEVKEYSTNLIEAYDSLYQNNFKEISDLIATQEENFQQEIKLVKSVQEDFSSVVENSVKSVVTVTTENSLGSGFIVDSAGFVVTNYHVIDDNEETITVLTYDRQAIPAELVGKDETKDLALLKIQEGNYDKIKLADSNSLQVGKKVIAIGNPLGLSFTVTEGIISGLDRTGPNGLSEYVQTDVSLNPGNSGGPLIDTNGEVVGINNFKIGGTEGLSFSLESNSIRDGVNAIANRTLIE